MKITKDLEIHGLEDFANDGRYLCNVRPPRKQLPSFSGCIRYRSIIANFCTNSRIRESDEARHDWFSKSWYINNHRDPPVGNDDDQENEDQLIVEESEQSEDDTL